MLKDASIGGYACRYSRRPLKKVGGLLASRQFGCLVRRTGAYLKSRLYEWLTPLVRLAIGEKFYTLDGESHPYLIACHNATWTNERAVEIPYMASLTNLMHRDSVLEVGNVMKNYGHTGWSVCDKYERGERLINSDVRSLTMDRRFKLIISVSTLEHVGFDENAQDPNGLVGAINNLRKHLAVGGAIHCTLPIGYNPHVDRAIATNKPGFDSIKFLVRTGLTAWVQAGAEDAFRHEYGRPYNCANAVAFCVARR